MEHDQLSYKESFSGILEPVKAMLTNLERTLSKNDWLLFVEKTRLSVINNPEQYLGRDIPDRISLGVIVSEIFAEFVREVTPSFMEQ